jgi:hypothetical protein
MAQILLQIPDRMLRDLDRVAPGRSRKRSRFVRLALQKALMDLEDAKTSRAYRRLPDDEPDWFDPRVWDEWRPEPPRRRTKRKSRKSAKP